MRIVDCEQYSFEWWAARCGRQTASRIAEIMPGKRGGELASRRNYRVELITERLTGKVANNVPPTPAMLWGTQQEPFARTAYELATGEIADQVGFIFHPDWDFSGASPDALVRDGGVEFKCPTTLTHISWLTAGIVPEEHADQLLWNMECRESDWWGFQSFDPRLPERLQRFYVTMRRDEERLKLLREAVGKLEGEIQYLISELGGDGDLPPIEPFLSGDYRKTVHIGVHDIPADLVELLDGAELIP